MRKSINSRIVRLMVAAIMAVLVTSPVLAESARVIDGDTLEWNGERVRLMGFDAPEMQQTCERGGVTWLCGKEARKALANWIGGRDVDCVGDERDRYERLLAHCSVDGQDVGEWMVSRGLAVAYYRFSYEYERAEHKAKSAKLGMWAGEFAKPWDWRKGRRK
jgi:endonuclease YncB( thermonuclease family)